MPGIRIRHHTRRSQMLPVPLLFEPWPHNRTVCGNCHIVHPCKVVHLTLDAEGTVIVTAPLKDKIWRVPQRGGFTVDSTVADPPTQNLAPETQRVEIHGIDIGGGLQVAEPNRRYATVTPAAPVARTVGLDEYVDIANRNGFTTATALNVLLAKILGLSVKEPDRGKVNR